MPVIALPSGELSYLMPSLENAAVSDACHPGVLSCRPDTGLVEAAQLMATHRVHCLVVMAENSIGESYVWGVISDVDLVRVGISDGLEATARSIAHQPIISLKPTMPLRKAIELMVHHNVTHAVVVDPEAQRPVGVLSTLDIVGVLGWGETGERPVVVSA
jgi:CBS domain-containing protein